jgi:hypothetical protein
MFATYNRAGQTQGPAVMLSLPYLVCLKMVSEVPHGGEGTLRQFVLAQKRGLETTDGLFPILVSDFHPL